MISISPYLPREIDCYFTKTQEKNLKHFCENPGLEGGLEREKKRGLERDGEREGVRKRKV